MSDLLVLTDDEVVALAARRPTPWPGGIPTVEGTADAVTASVFRGRRSLYVRGLTTEEGAPSAEIADVVEPLLDAPGRVLVYLADAEFRRSSWGLSSAHHVGTEKWIFETVSPVGVHKLSWRPAVEHRSYLTALLRSAKDAGPDHGSDRTASPEWLCALAESAGRGVVVSVRRDELLVGVVTLGGDRPIVEDQQSTSVSDAVDRLMAAACADDG